MISENRTQKSPGNLIGGKWTSSETGEKISVRAPSTGEVFAEIEASSASDVDQAVSAARKAADGGSWSKFSAVERSRLLLKFARAIEDNAEGLAEIESQDNGKPIKQARADMAATARYFEFYGAAADKVHGEVIPFLNGYNVQVLREPLGVTAHIIPWNYPAQMFGRTLAPALAMGNATVLKPAEEACLSTLRLAEIALEIGFPEGALNVVTGRGALAGAALSSHRHINFISFTGSPEVGIQIQTAAAKNFVACTLELGGKSPQIVFSDVNLDQAIPSLVGAIIQNAGQTCSAGSRALVHRSIFKSVVDELTRRFHSLVTAPHDAEGDLGALISGKQKASVLQKTVESKYLPTASGKLSEKCNPAGYFVPAMLFADVPEDSTLAQEEVFGPVLTVLPFEDEADAIRIANGTDFGLVAGVWSTDANRLMRVAKAVRCGQVFLNGYGAGGGIELPFGGIGKSGHGREKGFQALHEFSQTKTIVHNHG